ncbi:MAG: FaeA/PapI family transcriptional regulator [Pseudomonadota bacterium]
MSAQLKTTDNEDAVWDALIHGAPITTAEIAEKTALAEGTVRKYLNRWEDQKRVKREQEGAAALWRLRGPVEYEGVSALPSSPQEAIWRSMRVLKRFSQADLSLALKGVPSCPSEVLLRAYIQALLRAGYLKVLVKARPARGIAARYQLLRDTGPLPPDVKNREVVVDQNDQRVVAVKGARL